MRDNSTIDIVQLIQTVESKPILYDKSQSDYSNVVLRDDTWIEIAKILKSTDLECKRKWNYLRGKFAREIKTDANGSLYFQMPVENDSSDDGHWPYLKNMLFLLPHCKKRSKIISNSETIPKENVETTDSLLLKQKNVSPSTSTTYLELEESDDHIHDPEGESSNSYKESELKTSHEFVQVREQFPITSSGLPMHTTIITQNDSDIDTDKVIIFEDGSIKRRKFKEMVEDTVADVLSTVRDCLDRQSVPNETDFSSTQTMLNHFSRFVSSSLIGLPSRKRNAAIAHITAYLTDVRSEEDL
ncbi:Transcription factor Adf-1 [Pseudolycoriella hygida]|uniref:Transcription factor Adf-1 n=1 Tax=Pseudolycoriella hygida TaxID=35572 RepID=A0A9Q0MXX6_9DIPT|nr:Transcription factor Adf-1 [Pseudolycoriella hygida]